MPPCTPVSDDSFDAIVIGAGIAGLTTAALLSSAGLRVCAVEQASQAGGYLAGFERRGFRFDTSIHWLNQCGPGGIVRKLFDFLGPNTPATPPQTRIRRLKGDSFDYLLSDRPDELREQLICDFPAERRGIRSFFSAARKLARTLAMSADTFRTTKSMGLAEKVLFGLRSLPFVLPLVWYGRYSAPRGLSKFFRRDGTRRIFCSEENLLSCLIPISWSYAGDYQHPPRSGGSALAEWVCRVLSKQGVDLRLNSRVTSVLLSDGRAAGVRISDARGSCTLRAPRVLAACDVDSVYRTLLPESAVSRVLIDKIGKAQTYGSAVTVFLGLDCAPSELGLPGEELVVLTRDDVTREAHNSTDPHTAAITVLCPSSHDHSMAPPGKGTMILFVAAEYHYRNFWCTEQAADGQRTRGEAYRSLKKEFARILMERVEKKLVPGLASHIEVCEIATPMTYQRYTGNRNGSMMGFMPGMKNMRAGVAGHFTPVENLLICGQWSSYGGGVPSAVRAATNATLLTLQNVAPEFCAILKDVADGKLPPAEARRKWEQCAQGLSAMYRADHQRSACSKSSR